MSTNPFDITNPQFLSFRRRPSPSPSQSPTRTNERFPLNALDPLLSDLSPSRTLEALSASPTFTTDSGGPSSALRASIAAASPTQRAFAVRAAVAHKKLRDWAREVSAWEWPNGEGSDKGFLVPTWEGRAAKRRRLDGWGEDGNRDPVESTSMSGTGGESRLLSPVQLSGDNDIAAETEMSEEYWGSIPAPRVLEYERRIEDIKRELEALDVEELKSQVLDAHVPSRSRPSSSYSQGRDPSSFMHYVPLGDFTALITATTLQALPYLSRVTSLINTWSVRISVLRIVPTFLRDLDMAQEVLRLAFDAIKPPVVTSSRSGTEPVSPSLSQSNLRIVELSSPPQDDKDEASSALPVSDLDFTRKTFDVIRDILKGKVASLGQLLDNMLDDLEGRDDTIPEEWIEQMESVEENYGFWVVEAEKKVLEYECRLNVEAQAKEAVRIAALQPQKEVETEIERGVEDNTYGDENILRTTGGERDIGEAQSSDSNAEVDPTNVGIPVTTLVAVPTVSTAIAATTLLGSESSGLEPPASVDDVATSFHHDVLPDSSHDHDSEDESKEQNPQLDGLADTVPTSPQTRSEPLEQRPNGLADTVPTSTQTRSEPLEQRPNGLTDTVPTSPQTRSEPLEQRPNGLADAVPTSPQTRSEPLEQRPNGLTDTVPTSPQTRSEPLEQRPNGLTDTVPTSPQTRSEPLEQRPNGLADAVPTSPQTRSEPLEQRSNGLRDSGVMVDHEERDVNISVDPKTDGDNVSIESSEQGSATDSNISIFNNLRDSGYEPVILEEPERHETTKIVPFALTRERSVSSVSSDSVEQSPSVRQYRKRQDTVSSDSDHKAPLPALQITKRRSNIPVMIQRKNVGPASNGSDGVVSTGHGNMPDTIATGSKATQSIDGSLQARINSILTTIPARITLTSAPDAENNLDGQLMDSTGVQKAVPDRRTRMASTGSPSYTLAPAQGRNPRPRAKGGNPDIRMYHLHRSDGEAPIKLFVRLVGEKGERVMVRVGGGWSDLGAFLKDYASHHGRRSTSDGRIEVRDVPLRQRGSVASLAARAARGSTPRPDSAMSRPGSSLNARAPTTPQGESTMRQEITPPSVEGELGLAGPKSRRADMSAEKKAWVEGMLGEVRRASASTIEKKEDVKFGELGRVEGVKRVFRK